MSDPPILKICGVRTVEAASAAAAGGADWVGLVFVPKSVRCVEASEAKAVLDALPESVGGVGLFMHPDDHLSQVCRQVERLGLTTVQLHGRAEQTARQLKGVGVWRAAAFDPTTFETSLAEARQWVDAGVAVRGLVVDTPDEKGIGGGTGKPFDWSALRQFLDRHPMPMPWLLAGGLNPENVAEALATVRPSGVDVSSGVESEPGRKDPDRIAAFCAAVRGAKTF